MSYKRESRVCPACGQNSGNSRGRKNNFELLSCQVCDTLYTSKNPVGGPGEEDYDAYYSADNLAVPEFINRVLDEIVSTFEPYRKQNRVLDVGFGAGTFLEALKRAGWDVFGVEVSETATKHVRDRGFDVFQGTLADAGYPDNNFDVVIASEVLEHVPEPAVLLTDIHRVLRPAGLLWATTPHGRGISARILGLQWSTICPPEHLQLFSRTSIREVLQKSGFRNINISTHGTNPYEIINGLRSGTQSGSEAKEKEFNRVESSYQLNETMSGNPLLRIVKSSVNGLLNLGRIGDSLKIRAEK